MQSEDEIEFFNFVPAFLLNDLHEKLASYITNLNDPHLILAFEKNFYIFETFALKNIFSFPNEFKLERKLTDKRFDIAIQSLLDAFMKIVDENKFLVSEKIRIENQIELCHAMIDGCDKFLLSAEDVFMLNENKNVIEAERNKMVEMYNKFNSVEVRQNDSGIGLLMENEFVMNEIYKKEKEELNKKIKFDEIEILKKSIL